MYAAFWLDPKSQDPNKRIVVCLPFTNKPTTAWAILRSAVHENRTGGILSGPEEKLKSCVQSIDQHDQGWPDDPDRIVAAVTKLAQNMECTIVFRQNVEHDGSSQHAMVWQHLTTSEPKLVSEDDRRSIVRIPLVGDHVQVEAALEVARHMGWAVDEHHGAWKTIGNGVRLNFQRYQTTATRADLLIEYAVDAAQMSKQNSAGFSQQVKLSFNSLDEVLDTALGPTANRYKFILLIKDRMHSILFFGTKQARTLRQAIEQYVDHMSDRPSSDEPRSSKPDSKEEPDVFDQQITPELQHCRFWRLGPR